MQVGIEKIRAHPGTLSLDFEALARARGHEEGYAWDTVRGRTRSVAPTWEDPVTMAVNAAKPMLTEDDLADIELLIVGTESSTDQGKPISTFVAKYLGLSENCRNFETKHACYGGTSALMMAASWVASGVAPGKKALVIATDQSRMNLNVKWEYVMGGGAVALLVSDQPEFLELELATNGYWSSEVGDTFRPTSREEAGNTENSLYCYLDGLAGAYRHFAEKWGQTCGPLDFDRDFAAHIYHMPFSAMARRAHRSACRLSGLRTRELPGGLDAHYEKKVEPGSRYASLIGGSYTASTFFAMLSLIDHAPQLREGHRISVFSYGSGSCAEFYAARVGNKARAIATAAGLDELLADRCPLTVEEYEAVERERTDAIDLETWVPDRAGWDQAYERLYAGRERLEYRGVQGHFRQYGWS